MWTHWSQCRLELLDKGRTTSEIIDDAKRFRVRAGRYAKGEFSFALNVGSPHAVLIQQKERHYISLYWRGAHLFDGIVEKVHHKWESARKLADDEIEVTGRCLGDVLRKRYAIRLDANNDIIYTGCVDDGFKWVADHCMGLNAYPGPALKSRIWTDFVCAADKSEYPDPAKLIEPNNQNLLEYLQQWGYHYSVDFDVFFNSDMEFEFETWYPRRGVDRTETGHGVNDPCIFNDATLENVKDYEYFWDDYDAKNAIMDTDVSTEVTDDAMIAEWGRAELITENSAEDTLEVALTKNRLKCGWQMGFKESQDCEFVTDFRVGDLVTVNSVRFAAGTEDLAIDEVEATFDAKGWAHLVIVFGDPEPNLFDKMKGGGSGRFRPDHSRSYWPSNFRGLRDTLGTLVLPAYDRTITVEGSTYITVVATPAANKLTLTVTGVSPSGHTHAHTDLTNVTDSQHHNPVTLHATLDSNLLGLSTQQLTLDDQAKNVVFAGPASGVAAAPSFRSLVKADFPHTHGLTYSNTATGDDTHTHTPNYTATATDTKSYSHSLTHSSTATNSYIHGHTMGFACANTSEVSGHYHAYDKINSIDADTHSHNYDKLTAIADHAAHSHQYDKVTSLANDTHTHTYDKTDTPTGAVT